MLAYLLASLSAVILASGSPEHDFLEVSPSLRATGRARKLMSFGQRFGHIWGRCDRWNRDMTGCNLKSAFKCSSHISAGPEGGDVELRLGGLPPSTENEEVHLQWWAPRKSASPYDPLSNSPYNCVVYYRVLDAYPQYSDQDFNGGNVKVDENGEVVIRVHQPSSYMMHHWIAFPHIHLRLCTNESLVHDRRDAIFFTTEGPYISAGCNTNDVPYQILAHRYVGQQWSFTQGHGVAPQITTTKQDIITTALPTTTTTLPTTTSATTSVTTVSTTTRMSTTTTFPTTSVLATSATEKEPVIMVDFRLRSAKEALDLDALEFSPVYQCFLENLFFDHFSSDCVEKCAAHTDVKHGQCVRKETHEKPITITASWKLRVECGEACWEEKENVTRHHVRLAVADHLDLPFQEVLRVDLELSGERRLVDNRDLQEVKEAKLSVHVSSRRVAANAELHEFIDGPADASKLLGLPVLSVEHIEANAAVNLEQAPQEDPYQPAYEAAEKEAPVVDTVSHPVSNLPLPEEAIFGMAGGILVLFAAFFLIRLVRRTKAASSAPVTVKGVKVEEDIIMDNNVDAAKAEAQADSPPQFHITKNAED